jgi:3-deoxy-D-manno-octulosonic-acid transferase
MMIYNLVIYLYLLGVKIAALFQSKPAKMVQGHREVFDILREKMDVNAKYIWFHAASLGEFEQGRPLIERIRRDHPEYKILQTFFSPSGYEVRKNYAGADVVCYLPFDTPRNVRRFIDLARPAMAFFIKYEFWQNYLNELHRRRIPVYSVSSIFRPHQIFFRSYGKDYAKVLTTFTHLFVQNEESRQLLHGIGVDNTTVVGDTRFDRVLDIFHAAKQLPIVEAFKGDSLTLVAGSSWAPDEDLFIPYFNTHPEMKLIIAPHVVNDAHLKEILGKLKRPAVRYTEATEENVKQADCLIIDCYGLLSSIYRYGEMAYIGGGFGVSIHNVPEAAVYGIPVLFGPNNKKFMEAQQLKACEGAFEVSGAEDFNTRMDAFLSNRTLMKAAGERAGRYISEHAGAMEKIMKAVKL